MALNYTSLNEAWTKPNVAEKPIHNAFKSPNVQASILNEQSGKEESVNAEEPVKKIHTEPDKSIRLTNPYLLEFFKLYPAEYHEDIVYKLAMDRGDDNMKEMIETIYMVVICILVLVVVDVLMHFKKL